jgi:hypothetical protein
MSLTTAPAHVAAGGQMLVNLIPPMRDFRSPHNLTSPIIHDRQTGRPRAWIEFEA